MPPSRTAIPSVPLPPLPLCPNFSTSPDTFLPHSYITHRQPSEYSPSPSVSSTRGITRYRSVSSPIPTSLTKDIISLCGPSQIVTRERENTQRSLKCRKRSRRASHSGLGLEKTSEIHFGSVIAEPRATSLCRPSIPIITSKSTYVTNHDTSKPLREAATPRSTGIHNQNPHPSTSTRVSRRNMSSFFQHQTNLLSSKLEIVLDNDGVLDMIGGVNTGTSYSLPGHVLITLPALSSTFEGRQREVRDLTLTMEGKSEFYDEEFRYTPLRLYNTTMSLASPSTPLLLSPATSSESSGTNRLQYAVAFDLRIPGWLPPSHVTNMTNTSYGLVAHATVGWAAEGPCSSSAHEPHVGYSTDSSDFERISFACALTELSAPTSTSIPRPKPKSSLPYQKPLSRNHPLHPSRCRGVSKPHLESLFSNHSLQQTATEKSTTKWTPFEIRRHKVPVGIDGTSESRPGGIGERNYSLKSVDGSTSPVECVVTVPEWADVNGDDKSLRISLRLRAIKTGGKSRGTSGSTMGEGLQGMERVADVPEANGSSLRGAGTSVPMEREGGHGARKEEILTRMVELGMEVEEKEIFSSEPYAGFVQTFPLPANQPSRSNSNNKLLNPSFQSERTLLGAPMNPIEGKRTRPCLLADDGNQRNFFFEGDGLALGDERWRKVNVVLPMGSFKTATECKVVPGGRPQPEMDGPFLKIRHTLKIRVVCQTGPDNSHETVVVLSTPIRFGSCPATSPPTTNHPAGLTRTVTKNPKLPAYIQLFYENGDLRECDPLPLYSSISNKSPTNTIPQSPAPAYLPRSQSVSIPEPVLELTRSVPGATEAMDVDSGYASSSSIASGSRSSTPESESVIASGVPSSSSRSPTPESGDEMIDIEEFFGAEGSSTSTSVVGRQEGTVVGAQKVVGRRIGRVVGGSH